MKGLIIHNRLSTKFVVTFNMTILTQNIYIYNLHNFSAEMQDSCKFPSVLSGIYQYTDKAADCKGEINIGCLTDGEMIVETTCSNNRKSVNILECLQQWQEGSVVYVIVKTSGEDDKPLMCLVSIKLYFLKQIK